MGKISENRDSVKIKKILESAKKVALFGHISPDGDCIGSMLGLGRLLEKQGKKVFYYIPSKPSKMFNFLLEIKKIKSKFDYAEYDVLVFVDFSSYGRIAEFTQGREAYFDNANLVVIDHHPGSQMRSTLMIKDEDCMSSAELIFENASKWRPKLLDAKLATYLYMGLTTDSGNFVYDEDHERIFTNALNLIKLGANKSLIIDQLIRKKSLDVIKFTQIVLKRIQIKGDLLYAYYSDADLKKYNIDQEEAHYPLHVIQNIDGPKLFLLLKKIDGHVKGSLRSKHTKSGTVDCNAIAKLFGGGGHKPAAGFSLAAESNFKSQVDKITEKVAKIIK